MTAADTRKCRTLHLADTQQVERAAVFLRQQFGLQVLALPQLSRLVLHYELPQHSLAQLLPALAAAGFRLADSWWQRAYCRLIGYSEAVQLDNLECPDGAARTRELYCRLYQQHPHGDHDDTPDELRLER
ncbi:hypothetical protein ACFOLG_17980 [Vogesella facilis]|uniref:Type II secretion system protein GspE N-terminal domain-containing protein n=1 Tax=Vogesella facilis TaxID=1655232 RepID=A0ABV7RKQ3_9NEIS